MGYNVGDTIIAPTPLMTVFTQSVGGSGSFVKATSPPARFHRVRCWGPGGAGGGVVGAGTGTAEGGGGGAGGYVERWYLDSELSASEPFVVGSGGTGVSGGNGNSGSGATTFKGLSASPGVGGTAMTSGTASGVAEKGAGGLGSGGQTNARGGDGGKGRRIGAECVFANYGGASPGGGGQVDFVNFVAGNGSAGASPGGGGSGAFGAAANQTGGTGGAGKIEIVSFF